MKIELTPVALRAPSVSSIFMVGVAYFSIRIVVEFSVVIYTKGHSVIAHIILSKSDELI